MFSITEKRCWSGIPCRLIGTILTTGSSKLFSSSEVRDFILKDTHFRPSRSKFLISFASMEHVNYFIVSTDKAGTIRNCGLNERRIVCPVNENNAEEEEKQWDFYNKWLSSSLAKKLVIVELGEDFSNPNVIRWPFERIVMINQKDKMYRVHSTFYQIPKEIGDRACAFEMNGAQFIKELVKCC